MAPPILQQTDSSLVGHLCFPKEGPVCPRCQTYWAIQVALGAYDWEKKEWTPRLDTLNRLRAKGLLEIRISSSGEPLLIERVARHEQG
jgi:hypothetical protein